MFAEQLVIITCIVFDKQVAIQRSVSILHPPTKEWSDLWSQKANLLAPQVVGFSYGLAPASLHFLPNFLPFFLFVYLASPLILFFPTYHFLLVSCLNVSTHLPAFSSLSSLTIDSLSPHLFAWLTFMAHLLIIPLTLLQL